MGDFDTQENQPIDPYLTEAGRRFEHSASSYNAGWLHFARLISSPDISGLLENTSRIGNLESIQKDIQQVLGNEAVSLKQQRQEIIGVLTREKDTLLGTGRNGYQDGLLYEIYRDSRLVDDHIESLHSLFLVYDILMSKQSKETRGISLAEKGAQFQTQLAELMMKKNPDQVRDYVDSVMEIGSFLSDVFGVNKNEFKFNLEKRVTGALGEIVATAVICSQVRKGLLGFIPNKVEARRSSVLTDMTLGADIHVQADGETLDLSVKSRSGPNDFYQGCFSQPSAKFRLMVRGKEAVLIKPLQQVDLDEGEGPIKYYLISTEEASQPSGEVAGFQSPFIIEPQLCGSLSKFINTFNLWQDKRRGRGKMRKGYFILLSFYGADYYYRARNSDYSLSARTANIVEQSKRLF